MGSSSLPQELHCYSLRFFHNAYFYLHDVLKREAYYCTDRGLFLEQDYLFFTIELSSQSQQEQL